MAEMGLDHYFATDSHSPADLDPKELQVTKNKLSHLIKPDNFQLVTLKNPLRVQYGEANRKQKKADLAGRKGRARLWQLWKSHYRKQQLPINYGK